MSIRNLHEIDRRACPRTSRDPQARWRRRARVREIIDPREVELKFHLPPGSRATLEASSALAAAKPKQQYQVTTYFDTPEHLLDRTGLTLRVRRSGDIRTQTVKSRASGQSLANNRGKWEWRIRQDKPEIGRLMKTPALVTIAMAIKDRLDPAFVTDIRRSTRLLRPEDKTVVEVAIDEGFVEAGTAREPVSELELEMKRGSLGAVYRLAAQFQALAPMWILPESTAARGWRLRTGQTEGGHLRRTPSLGRLVQAAAGFHELLSATLGHLVANIGASLRGDPEALHEMRLAVRESRAILQLFERHLDPTASARFNAGLRLFGGIFGAARDWDVFCLETLPAAMADLPDKRLEDLNMAAEVERQFAHAAMADALRGHDFTAMVLSLAIWAETEATEPSTPGDKRMAKRLRSLAPSLLDRIARKVKQRGRHANLHSVVKRHYLRKSLKKLCFDVEALAGLYASRALKIYHSRCEALEKILGLANDAAVTKRLAWSLVSARRPGLEKPVGALVRWSDRRGRKALQGLKPALKDFRATPAFWS